MMNSVIMLNTLNSSLCSELCSPGHHRTFTFITCVQTLLTKQQMYVGVYGGIGGNDNGMYMVVCCLGNGQYHY